MAHSASDFYWRSFCRRLFRVGGSRSLGAIVCACVLAVSVSGCSISQANKSMALRESATEFSNSLRWSNFERAAAFVPEESRAEFIRKKRAAQGQVQILEYEIRTVDYVAGADRARIVIAAVWTRTADPVSHAEILEQEWRWLTNNHWVMAKQLTREAGPAPVVQPGDAL